MAERVKISQLELVHIPDMALPLLTIKFQPAILPRDLPSALSKKGIREPPSSNGGVR